MSRWIVVWLSCFVCSLPVQAQEEVFSCTVTMSADVQGNLEFSFETNFYVEGLELYHWPQGEVADFRAGGPNAWLDRFATDVWSYMYYSLGLDIPHEAVLKFFANGLGITAQYAYLNDGGMYMLNGAWAFEASGWSVKRWGWMENIISFVPDVPTKSPHLQTLNINGRVMFHHIEGIYAKGQDISVLCPLSY